MLADYDLEYDDTFTVRDASGVKCDQVLRAIAAYWDKAVSARVAAQVRRAEGWPKGTKVTRRDTLGDHRFFEGWRPPVVRKDGRVYLAAHGFGS